jgi:hypothetical protein
MLDVGHSGSLFDATVSGEGLGQVADQRQNLSNGAGALDILYLSGTLQKVEDRL